MLHSSGINGIKKELIIEQLSDKQKKIEIAVLDSIDSTNLYAETLARNGVSKPMLIVASSQTDGHGTKGRSYFSPLGGAYFSLLIPLDGSENISLITPAAAVAAAQAAETICSEPVEIKWVNDILINRKKVCGILCKSSLTPDKKGYAVVGAGANIIKTVKDFPDEIKDTASYIHSSDESTAREKFIASFVNSFEDCWLNHDENKLYEEYLSRLGIIGEKVQIIKGDKAEPASVIGLENDYRLLVINESGTQYAISNDEVKIILD